MIKNTRKSTEEENIKTEAQAESEAEEIKDENAENVENPQESAAEESAAAPAQDNAELAELKDKYLRLLAEYDNFKKRTVKEKEAIYKDSVGDTVTALLPVLDNFERALASFGDDAKDSEFYKGFEMIYNQTSETFKKLGVEPIEAIGCEFDPELHNAVMHIEDETVTDNTIVEEFQKGYTYRDKVIRYSMVKVAN